MDQPRQAPQLTGPQRARLHHWLRRQGRSTAELAALTPLMEARYAARHQGQRIQYATVLVLIAAMVAWVGWRLATGGAPLPATGSLAVLITIMVVSYASSLAAQWYQRRADRHLGGRLARRAARPAAVDLRTLLGPWSLPALAVSYGGGALLGVGGAAFAAHPPDRTLSAGFTAGVALFTGLSAIALTDIARRPALADDDRSLADDELLRREDATAATAPWPAMLAVVAGVASTTGALFGAYLAYAAATGLLWAAWVRAVARTRRAAVRTGGRR